MDRVRLRRALARLGALLVAGAVVAPAVPAQAHEFKNRFKERRHLVERVKEQLGDRYAYGGTGPNSWDCSGLTRWTYYNNGDSLPHDAQRQYEMGTWARYKRIHRRSHLKKGDIVFFHTYSGAKATHAGIYIGHGRFVSATSHGVRRASVWDPYYWGPRWVGATRTPATIRGEN